MSYAFGIDLGTTYSCISYVDEFGKAVVLKNSNGDHTTPSVVFVESASNIVVGEEAKRAVEVEQDKTVQFIKRKMGKEENTVILNGTTYTAQEISSYILKKLVDDANNELQQTGVLKNGERITDVVITCPAYFGMNEKNATMEAGKLAGLNVLDIINEPTAAAISYSDTVHDKEETVLVYDLGGGTFDITVMNIKGGNITVICTGGDDKLGGKDWDQALVNYIIEEFESENGEDLTEDDEAMATLMLDVETWKKSLTSREKVNINVRAMGARLRQELTREKYEQITRHLLTRTKDLLDNILETSASYGYPLSRIDKILLVGGSSRMPQVARMIEEDYGVKPSLQDPDEAVAKGAAKYALDRSKYQTIINEEARRTGKSVEEIKMEGKIVAGGMKITNVLSCTYGIKVMEGGTDRYIISNFLKVNSPLPARETKEFYTVVDGQSGVNLNLYETRSTEDSIDLDDREPLTVIEMRFNNSVPQNTPIRITLTLDNSGILHVQATEGHSGSKLDTTFKLSQQMSAAEMRQAEKRVANASVE